MYLIFCSKISILTPRLVNLTNLNNHLVYPVECICIVDGNIIILNKYLSVTMKHERQSCKVTTVPIIAKLILG